MFLLSKPAGLNKSFIITFISVMQSYGTAILTFVLPLYLFALFQSETVVGNFASAGALMSIICMLSLGFILRHLSRVIVFKIASALLLIGIFQLIFLNSANEAYIAGALTKTAIIIIPIILSLYLRDLTKVKDLPKRQGIYIASMNLAWATGPIIAGFLINLIGSNEASAVSRFLIEHVNIKHVEYIIPFILSMIFYVITIGTFIWGKFIIKHPHLKIENEKVRANEIHHIKHLANITEYFNNKKRYLSFINLSFIGMWLVILLIFMPIFLKHHNVNEEEIGLIIGCFFIPLVILEGFLDKIIKLAGGSLNALIIGYTIFAFFVSLAFIVGYKDIYLFISLLVAGQIGVAITQPLQEFMYYEGTNKKNEHKFYSIHRLGNNFFALITPILMGAGINIWGIDKVFRIIPFLFIFVFYFLYKFKKAERKKKKKLF